MSSNLEKALLSVLSPEDGAPPPHLRTRLNTDADAVGLLDVAYRTVDSPIGALLLAATEQGLVRVAFEVQGHDAALEDLATRVSPRILRAPRRLDTAAHEIDEYLTGRRTAFDLRLDLQLAAGFRREVLHHLPDIRYGRTASYAAMATAVGNPKAVRAVGTACAMNPLPLVIPCHRVVRSDGTIGQYAGGIPAKQTLLALEGRPERQPARTM